MDMSMIQVMVIAVCAVILVAGMILRSKGVSIASVVEQVQATLNPANALLTVVERKAKAKDRKNRRRIGWAKRRLVSYYQICHNGTRVKAMNHLNKMAYSLNPFNANLALEVLELLALGHGDQKFSARAMEVIKSVSPRRALKVQIEYNKAAMPEITQYIQPRAAKLEQVPQGMPQTA
ncbi:MAG: hypothetical protein NTX82_04170 [Candidatus Parcubacteria bacterium]|nr:hypothetical protein [Candidatus Parcubacteria bacterium]